MSYGGRSWPKVGRKMLALHPLAQQKVAPDDSVLGPFANTNSRGLKPELDYLALVQPHSARILELDATGRYRRDASGKNQHRYVHPGRVQFSLLFGLSIQAYEFTLISDDSSFDRLVEGTGVLTSQEQAGRRIFNGSGGCSGCHRGAEFTATTYSTVAARGPYKPSAMAWE